MIKQTDDLYLDSEVHMQKCIKIFKTNINKIHIGRVSPSILDNIKIEYYGTLVPFSQLTNTIIENSRTLAITVFDPKTIKLVEKAILTSNLGLNPISHENVIRIKLPLLTEERRHLLIKTIRAESEKTKISIRNIRRAVNDKAKVLLKRKIIHEDEEHFFQTQIQKLTNFWIKEVDTILSNKESELIIF